MSQTDLSNILAPSLVGIDPVIGRARLEKMRGPEVPDFYLDNTAEIVSAIRQVASMECLGTVLASGTSRNVYSFEGCIVKVPHVDFSGGYANSLSNIAEVETRFSPNSPYPVTPCRLVWHETGIPLVVMEAVDTQHNQCDEIASWPLWAGRVDCEQVAWSEIDNAWTCYDAGYTPIDFAPEVTRNSAQLLLDWIDHLQGVAVAA